MLSLIERLKSEVDMGTFDDVDDVVVVILLQSIDKLSPVK